TAGPSLELPRPPARGSPAEAGRNDRGYRCSVVGSWVLPVILSKRRTLVRIDFQSSGQLEKLTYSTEIRALPRAWPPGNERKHPPAAENGRRWTRSPAA